MSATRPPDIPFDNRRSPWTIRVTPLAPVSPDFIRKLNEHLGNCEPRQTEKEKAMEHRSYDDANENPARQEQSQWIPVGIARTPTRSDPLGQRPVTGIDNVIDRMRKMREQMIEMTLALGRNADAVIGCAPSSSEDRAANGTGSNTICEPPLMVRLETAMTELELMFADLGEQARRNCWAVE